HTDIAPLHPGLLRHLRRAHVIHCTDAYFAYAATARRAVRDGRRALVSSVHTQTPEYCGVYVEAMARRWLGNHALGRALLRHWRPGVRMERRMSHKLERHLGESDWVLSAEQLASRSGPSQPRHSRLRRGIDRSVFTPDARPQNAAPPLAEVPKDATVLACTGRLSHGKRVELVVDLTLALRDKGHNVHAVFAGDGPLRPRLQARLGRYGHFLGHVAQTGVAAMLRRAQLFVFPSQIEHWPNAVAEAKACGAPVLVAPCGGGRLVETDGADGIIVDGTLPAWMEAAQALLSDPARLCAVSKAGAAHVERVIPSWESVLKEDLFPVWDGAWTAVSRRDASPVGGSLNT
ncbi:MAG: glycosyltransferase family 4 protein, partial [Chromatiales bacterium]|nr:glycosyltransferase family 4 protein [Chromatiales bacterium]